MEVKKHAWQRLMQLQANISLARLKKLQGKTLDMLVEGINTEESLLVGRTYRDAPEIDGLAIAVASQKKATWCQSASQTPRNNDIIGELVKK